MDQAETLPYPSPTSYNTRINSGRIRPRRSVLSRFAAGLFSAMMTCFFATIGSIVGAVTGGLIGLATESGLFRGAGIGAISGAVFCIEAVESSIALRQTSNRSGIRSLVFVVDIVLSLLSGRLVREKVGPAVQSAVQSQMSAIEVTETTSSMDVFDIFETGTKFQGMARESVEKIPKILITSEDNTCCCSVCLQDFQVGESVRSLPQCNHMFHLPCIDGWLIGHGSCPLCRRDF